MDSNIPPLHQHMIECGSYKSYINDGNDEFFYEDFIFNMAYDICIDSIDFV